MCLCSIEHTLFLFQQAAAQLEYILTIMHRKWTRRSVSLHPLEGVKVLYGKLPTVPLLVHYRYFIYCS